jgi:hypothetical protein
MHMISKLAIVIGPVLAAVALGPQPASAQNSELAKKLATAKNIVCSFTTQATGNWTADKPTAAVTTAKLDIAFFKIDVDEGTAEEDTGFGRSLIVARLSQGYLHLMHTSDAGPLYVTSIFPKTTADGRVLAAHVRMEYLPAAVPGFTSRPELYVGTCQLNKPGVE